MYRLLTDASPYGVRCCKRSCTKGKCDLCWYLQDTHVAESTHHVHHECIYSQLVTVGMYRGFIEATGDDDERTRTPLFDEDARWASPSASIFWNPGLFLAHFSPFALYGRVDALVFDGAPIPTQSSFQTSELAHYNQTSSLCPQLSFLEGGALV